MKKTYRIRTVKILALALAVLLSVLALQEGPLHYWDSNVQRVTGFRLEKEDSLDVVLLGASEVINAWSAPYAYEHYGFTSYPFALSGCSDVLWYTQLEEVLDRQSPQLVVVEISGVNYERAADLHHNSDIHYLLDDMPLSPLKLRAFSRLCSRDTDSPLCMQFPLIKYHSNWHDLKLQETARNDRDALLRRGYAALRGGSAGMDFHSPSGGTRNVAKDRGECDLAPEAEQALRDFLALCEREGVEVLFVRLPHRIGVKDAEMYKQFRQINRAGRIVQEEGFRFLNLDQCPGDIGLDQTLDYSDRTHMNLSGQLKMTDWLARYLVEECGVTPRPQTEENRQQWEASAEYYRYYCDYMEQLKKSGTPKHLDESAELIAELDAMKAQAPAAPQPGALRTGRNQQERG